MSFVENHLMELRPPAHVNLHWWLFCWSLKQTSEDFDAVITLKPLKVAEEKKKKNSPGIGVCMFANIYIKPCVNICSSTDIRNDSNIIIPTVQLKLQMNELTWR